MLFVKNKVVRNAAWIIACKVVQAFLQLVITMLTARYLGPSNYGVINYAASVIAFAVPVMQLGVRNTLVQELVAAPDSKGKTLGTSLVMNLVSAIFCMIGITAFSMVANAGEKETIIVCVLYSFCLLFQSVEVVQYWFQEKLESKYVAITMLIAYIASAAYQTYLLVTYKNIYWFAVSQSVQHIIIAGLLLVFYHRQGGEKLTVSLKCACELFSRSKYYILSNMMVTVFAQTDRVMLKLMVNDAVTGYYSAAVNCANMTNFIFLAIIDSARPPIFQSKQAGDRTKYEQGLVKLYSVIIYMSVAQCIAMTVFAKLIIHILYGASYYPAVAALQVAVWYTSFAHVGLVRDIWILAEGKQSILWKINILGAMANVVLNFILIPYCGMMGAAIASLITQALTNVGMSAMFKSIRYSNKLMLRGCNLSVLFKNKLT